MKYENRIVLFLDILGFSELVSRSEKDKNDFEKIKTSIRIIRKIFNVTQKTKERTISQFSDSIVVSFLVTEKGEVDLLLQKTKLLIKRLILNKIVCRGGIAQGKLIHDNIFMFGPAFIKAYKLECSSAIYPRVIIEDESIIKIGIENYGFHPSQDQSMEESEIKSLLAKDIDGFYYINYFSVDTFWELSKSEKQYIKELRKLIVENLSSNLSNIKARAKFEWMKTKFNEKVPLIKTPKRLDTGTLGIWGSEKESKFYKNLNVIE
jgi:hypothetical protein